ncbi:MAG: glycosyltransferase family 9 protein [Candidatus Paceibacterota bacterium]
MKEKVLIIKPGYCEVLTNESGKTTSLGDVLRSTAILHLYKDSSVSWVTDEAAIPLLGGNPYIDRIFPFNLTTVLQLQAEKFDVVINLEKVPGICAFSDSLKGWRRYGFRFDSETGTAKSYDGSQHVLEICFSEEGKRTNQRCWEEFVFEMVGSKWQGEMPVLGYKPESQEIFDVGFNHLVGAKWPTKAWPLESWKQLESLIGNDLSVSWQEGIDSIEKYIEWINSCRTVVTNDSLGLHIAHALSKKIIALFGPTSPNEVYVKDGIKIIPNIIPPCMPCFSNKCRMNKESCMHDIDPKTVFRELKAISR